MLKANGLAAGFVLAACVGVSIAAPAAAFQVDGFQAGMSRADVELPMGVLYPLADNDPREQVYFSRSPSRGDWSGPSFSFCFGRLYAYQTSIDGGFSAFNLLLQQTTERLGQGTYFVTNNETQIGRFSMLDFVWQERGWGFKVSITNAVEGHRNPLVVQRPVFTRRYDARRIICG